MADPIYTLSVTAGGVALLGAGLQALGVEIGRLTADLNAQLAAQDLARAVAQAAPEPAAETISAVRSARDDGRG